MSEFANPFNACEVCGRRVTGYDGLNRPCGHKGGWNSVCPSWSPVDGCNCQKHLGRVEHGTPPEESL